MIRSKLFVTVALLTAIAMVWILPGCGGNSAGPGTQAGKGAVTGWIIDVVTSQGIGNITVVIGGENGVSATPDGSFTVRNIEPGIHDIIVNPTALFVAPPGPPVQVTVQAGTVTALPGPIAVIDPNYVPPGR